MENMNKVEICIGKRSGKTYNKIQEMAKEIVRLEKENEQLKEENFDQVYMKAIADYKDKIRTEIKELEEILEKRKTIDIIEKINRLEELLGDE